MSQIVAGGIMAFGHILGGQSKQTMYNRKAADARLRGRITAINLELKGAQLLNKINAIMASSIARSQVGLGSTDTVGLTAGTLRHGFRDYSIIKDNITIQKGRAESQAQEYFYAGEIAVRDSYINAMASLAGGHAQQSQLGYPSFGSGSTTNTPTGSQSPPPGSGTGSAYSSYYMSF